MALLIGLSTPFITFIKKLSSWCCEKKLGLWESSLQSEKPVSLGWLFFLTNTMDPVPLKERTLECPGYSSGFKVEHGKHGMQGPVKAKDQVWVLHICVDELDVKIKTSSYGFVQKPP